MPTSVTQALQGIFPQGTPTSLMEEAQPLRSMPIGTPGWQPDISAHTLNPALEQAATYGMWNPRELGLDPFSAEQIISGRRFLAEADPGAASQYIPTPDYAQEDMVKALQDYFSEAVSKQTPISEVPGAYEVASLAPSPISSPVQWREAQSQDVSYLPPIPTNEEYWNQIEAEGRSVVEEARAATREGVRPVTEALKGLGSGIGSIMDSVPTVDSFQTSIDNWHGVVRNDSDAALAAEREEWNRKADSRVAWDEAQAQGISHPMDVFYEDLGDARETAIAQAGAPDRAALEISDVDEEARGVREHLDIVFGKGVYVEEANNPNANRWRNLQAALAKITPIDSLRDKLLDFEDPEEKVDGLVNDYNQIVTAPPSVRESDEGKKGQKDLKEEIADTIRDQVNNEVFQTARDSGETKGEAYSNENVIRDRRDLDELVEKVVSGEQKINKSEISKLAKSGATERAAEASRKAEAKREADTKKKAAEQRAALDSASQRALQNHMAWMATQAAQRAEEERLRALRGYGSGGMWT